jgi:transcription termination/antitermination protein NusA
VPEDQLSLAIGRDGQNARLAAKLTSWRIDIKSLPEAASDALYKVQNDAQFEPLLTQEAETIPQLEMILAKKAEGRPVTPEEYQILNQFVDRVERGAIRQRQAEKQAEEERKRIAQAKIPSKAFEIPLEDFEVSDRVYAVISEAGFLTVGDLMLEMKLNPDNILALNGMGPKAMAELEKAIATLTEKLRAEEVVEELEAAAEEPLAVAEEEPEAQVAAEEVTAVEAEEPVTEELVAEEAALEAQPADEIAEPVAEVVDIIEEPAVEQPIAEEPQAEMAAEGEIEPVSEEPVVKGEEEVPSWDELFAMSTEEIGLEELEDEEGGDLDDSESKRKKKGKKRKKFVEMEYDPEKDVMIVKKKRKRQDGWDDNWDF